MTYKKYLVLSSFLIAIFLSCIGYVSYHFDPAGIYHAPSKGNYSSSTYASLLIKSESGLLWHDDSLNWRDVKGALADDAGQIDCAVMGSSHSFQISSIRPNASLKNLCKSIINMGVPGGTLEDYLALTHKLINRRDKPKTIVFEISPWALDFNRDARWKRYKPNYFAMNRMLKSSTALKNEKHDTSKLNYLTNLINPFYFMRSIKQINRKKPEIENAPIFNYSKGIESPVFLSDGSQIYSKKYMIERENTPIPIGGTIYKIKENSQYSEQAISLFSDLVRLLRDVDIHVVLIMTPYHHNVWADKDALTTRALIDVGSRIQKLGKELGVNVLGSYNPQDIGCSPKEFFDFMHPKDVCLSKISN